MKSLTVLVLTILLLTSCKKENETSAVPGMDTIDTVGQTILLTGTFSNGPWGTVSGQARVLRSANGAFTLALQNVNISSGPDLHVYLSKEVQPINFIDLGLLRSTSGNQLYTISGSPDFSQYKYALIHCQKFDHLFGSALLQP